MEDVLRSTVVCFELMEDVLRSTVVCLELMEDVLRSTVVSLGMHPFHGFHEVIKSFYVHAVNLGSGDPESSNIWTQIRNV
jgi:hypothetical protein